MVKTLKKIRKIGNSYYISIPKTYIKDNILSTNKEYEITIKEVSKEQNLNDSELNEANFIANL